MENSTKILSDITVFAKYAKHNREAQRRETWEEIVDRNKGMMIAKYPLLAGEINKVYDDFVIPKKVMTSMRSLQFGGEPIFKAPNRVFNCAYAPAEKTSIFNETMFLLLGGSGVGYSVQGRHVNQLPELQGPDYRERRFLIGDSIEGWADAVKVLMESYFYGKIRPVFDYNDIREKGAELITTGGKAPGPQPLRECLEVIEGLLVSVLKKRGRGTKLKPIEVHDIICHIADAVLAGGIRRAALICLFDRWDTEMLNCKAGEWYKDNLQRARANNSAVLPRSEVGKEEFFELMQTVEDSKAGEPGVYWTNDPDWGTNPCCEIALQAYQFCNLTEIVALGIDSQEELEARARAASFLGTLQAGFTDFHYLNPEWKRVTEEDALLGVGMTGIASGDVLDLDLESATEVVLQENERIAEAIGINKAARTTTVKPSGTSSLVAGSSSGIHAWHNDYYIRRVTLGKNEALYQYLVDNVPGLIEDSVYRDDQAYAAIPQKAPETAIHRTETMYNLLNRVSKFNREWVKTGHRTGKNSHNVSCTISVKDGEWGGLATWMWDNRDDFNGIAVLPYDGGSYQQTPFEDISEERFNELSQHLVDIDLTQVTEEQDHTDLSGEIACSGPEGCEVT